MITRSPFGLSQRYAHLRAADLQADISSAARVYFRRLDAIELSEITATVVKSMVEQGRSDLWLTDQEFINLCTTLTTRSPLERICP